MRRNKQYEGRLKESEEKQHRKQGDTIKKTGRHNNKKREDNKENEKQEIIRNIHTKNRIQSKENEKQSKRGETEKKARRHLTKLGDTPKKAGRQQRIIHVSSISHHMFTGSELFSSQQVPWLRTEYVNWASLFSCEA